MDRHDYDLVVIGTGPGGEGASMQAAKAGRRVAVVERHFQVGGGCTHWGTIPSKSLRHAVHRLNLFQGDPLFSDAVRDRRIDFPDLLRRTSRVIDAQVALRRGFYQRNGVEVVAGHARFIDPHTVEVANERSPSRRLSATKVVIATGSRPYRPAGLDFTHPRIRDADTILSLTSSPRTVSVYGAGVIGCEYTSIFRKLGCKVDLVDQRDRLLSFLDDEIIDALAYHLRDQGVMIRHNENLARVEADDHGVVLHLESGKRIRSDLLLYAAGRTANTDDLGLDRIGLEPDGRGRLAVDDDYRTGVEHVYAVGDVIGWPSLASAAYDQGRFAANHAIHGHCDQRLVRMVPTGIYTSPEISSLGATERELTADKVPYEVGHSFFRSLARAQITGQTAGMLKLLFHRETKALLGIHCFGFNAAEIVHIGQAIMAQEGAANTIEYFANTTFNYPTMAEAYRVAALNGLNRLF